MKHIIKTIVFAACTCLNFISLSQTIDPGATGFFLDADLIARRHFGGSARMMGMAGAQTALGGDLSSVYVNPAGIGVYRSSDFGMTAGIQLNSTTTNFNSNNYKSQMHDNNDNFHLGNIGIVLAQSDDSQFGGDWKSEGIAISYSRLSNYHTRYNFRNEGSTYNFRDYVYDISAGIPPSYITSDNFPRNTFNEDLVAMAFDTYLLNDEYDESTNSFNDDYANINPYGASTQEGEVSISGGQSQWDFGYGANYQDKVYLGVAMGVATYKRNITTIYKEELENTTNTPYAEFRNLTYTTEEQSRGTGLNFKAGVIAKPSDIVRLGLSLETPTFYKVDIKYSSSLNATFNGGQDVIYGDGGNPETINLSSYSTTGRDFVDELSLRSPYRLNTGIAIFAGKKGFVSADAEYVMYSRTRINKFNGSSAGTFEDNNTLKSVYKNAFNLRLGGELRLDDIRLRAGYAFYPNTVRNDVLPSTQKQFITGGIGYYVNANYFDIAIVHSTYESDYTPYPDMSGTIKNNHNDLSVMLTYGFRF